MLNTNKKYKIRLVKKYRIYFITALIFIIWISFFDLNSFYYIYKYKKSIKNLEEEKQYYLDKIAEDSLKLEQLRSKEMIEKYAREHFFMKSSDEDVFVIIEE